MAVAGVLAFAIVNSQGRSRYFEQDTECPPSSPTYLLLIIGIIAIIQILVSVFMIAANILLVSIVVAIIGFLLLVFTPRESNGRSLSFFGIETLAWNSYNTIREPLLLEPLQLLIQRDHVTGIPASHLGDLVLEHAVSLLDGRFGTTTRAKPHVENLLGRDVIVAQDQQEEVLVFFSVARAVEDVLEEQTSSSGSFCSFPAENGASACACACACACASACGGDDGSLLFLILFLILLGVGLGIAILVLVLVLVLALALAPLALTVMLTVMLTLTLTAKRRKGLNKLPSESRADNGVWWLYF